MSIYRRKIFAAAMKVETTSGTDAVPSLATAADVIRLVNTPTPTQAFVEPGTASDPQHGGLGRIQRNAPKGEWMSVELVVEARGKGTAYAAGTEFIEADALLRAAGFSKGFGTGNVVFTTLDAGMETATLYLYNTAGKLIKMVGCVAKGPKVTFVPGQPVLMSFTVVGKVASVTEVAPGTVAWNTVMAPVWADTTVTVGALSTATGSPDQLVPRRLEIDVQTTEAIRPWAGAGALIGHAIVDRNVRATMEIEVLPLATFDPYALARQSSSGATSTAIVTRVDGGAGNIIEFTTGQWMLEPPGETDLSGLTGYTLTGDIMARSGSGSAAGREFAITYRSAA